VTPRRRSHVAAFLCALAVSSALVRAQESRPTPEAEDAPALTERASREADAGRLDEAVKLLERALHLRPDESVVRVNLARMLVRRGVAFGKDGAFEAAFADLDRAVETAPEERRSRAVRADLRRERGDVFRAETEIRTVLAEEPGLAYAFEVLARCRYDDDDLVAALDALEAAEKLDPERAPKLASFRAKLVREFEAEKDFDRVERGTFLVKFDGREFRGAAEAVLEMLDVAERKARDLLGHVPRRRTSVVLYTGKDFSAVTGAHAWTGGLFDGKIRLPVRNFYAARDDVARTLTHEFMHLVVRDLGRRCPTWLNEGLAQLAEGRSAEDARRRLRGRELKRVAELPDDWFGLADAGIVSTYYAQGLSFTAWLMRDRGPAAMRDLLGRLDGKTPFAAAFEAVYGRPPAELEDSWRETLP
jgi:tetratricopeptide (TPR) repeat protein